MKALVVRLSAIGDVVHTLPVLAALRKHGWSVGWVVQPAAHPLLIGQPDLAQLVPVPPTRGLRLTQAGAAMGTLRREAYDVALDFQGLWKSAACARFSGARRVVGFDARWRREPASAWLVRERMPLPSEALHVVDKNLSLLRALDIDALGLREFPLPSDQAEAARVATGVERLGLREFALLNPGGGWASKLWRPDFFGRLARALLNNQGLRSLVSWGPGEESLADRVVAASSGAAVRCFPTSLPAYVELARRASLVVAADTGPLHLACAVGAPVVGLYGPTDPARNGPFSENDVTVRHIPPCAPCHGRRCSRHAGIMDTLTPDEVLVAAEERLRRTPRAEALAL